MKKIWVSLFMLAAMNCSAATRKWDGEAGNGLWNTAANWSGNIVPRETDDVILDHSFVSAGYAVLLPAGNFSVTILTLLIDPGNGDPITLILPSTNTAIPGLYITEDGDALVLNANAVLRNSSGASSGTGIEIEDVFRINNGGRYIHNTARANAAIVSSLSAEPGTELGIFEFDVPAASYTVSLSGRTYGSLVLSSAARGNIVNYTGSGAIPLHINGNLQINTRVSFNISMTGDCIIHGNYQQASSSVFDLQTSSGNNLVRILGNVSDESVITKSGSGLPVLQMNGSVNQNISIDTLMNAVKFSVNNPAGITLLSPLKLSYNLEFINGRIRTSTAALLTMADNAVHTGSSAAGFVEGPMKKAGDEDFTFPVGKGSIYTPVVLGLGTGASATDEFIVEYIRANPQSIYGADYEIIPPPGTIDHISYAEHWTITSNTGTAVSKDLTLPVNCESFCRDIGSLFVAGYDPGTSRWKSAGWSGSTTSAPAACTGYRVGTITSGAITGFAAFTLATSQSWVVNPLPVNLVAFNATLVNSRKVLVNWQIACCEDLDFEIQRAGKDRLFHTIARISGNRDNFFYRYEDFFPVPGINYYRLKVIDNQHNVFHSRIASLTGTAEKLQIISLVPTVISSETSVTIVSSAARLMDIVIIDAQGRPTRKLHHYLQTGTTTIILRLNDLPGGIYYLIGITAEERTEATLFFKN
jgi:hypothetical protein